VNLTQNPLLVAFSTDFIPRLFHNYSKEFQNTDYLEFTFAKFNTSEGFDGGGSRVYPNSTYDVSICRYPEFRNGPEVQLPLIPYKRPAHYWQILAARLAFIIIFQNVVAWLQQFIDWAIPDKPAALDSLMKRENYLVSNKIIKEERQRVIQNTRAKLNEVDYVNGGVYFEAKS
jgi:anoctamin-1